MTPIYPLWGYDILVGLYLIVALTTGRSISGTVTPRWRCWLIQRKREPAVFWFQIRVLGLIWLGLVVATIISSPMPPFDVRGSG
jgi:hypothetical protein